MDLTLQEFCEASSVYCLHRKNAGNCEECDSLISAAKMIQREGISPLSSVFKAAFPGKTYRSEIAKHRLLKIPLACIRVGNPSSGLSELLLMESIRGANYEKIQELWNANIIPTTQSTGLTKGELKQLLSLTQSDCARECIRYAVYKTSNLTPTGARKKYGMENMEKRAARVEECIEENLAIRKAFEEQVSMRLEAALGVVESSEDEGEAAALLHQDTVTLSMEQLYNFVSKLRDSELNWFQFVESVEAEMSLSADELHAIMDKVYQQLSTVFSTEEMKVVCISKEAFDADYNLHNRRRDRNSRAVNGEIVTESEEEDSSLQAIQDSVEKKVAAIKRAVRRKRAKVVADLHFLERCKSKRLSTILHQCPDIGSTIEKFVENCNVGADAWRRTGLLTFDGNAKVTKKCTYQRIQHHLESVYHRPFSYGTVVQLCVARNHRRRSAHRYKGVAQVTSRRARKGFMLKFNPDTHWSNAFYRSLNVLQLTDGDNIMFVNRDDASGFRMDTLTTHHQYSNPVVKGKEILTTYTDYVNRYPSVIQTTSYNFTGTKTTPELCAGVVKAQPLFTKSPAQHMADLRMLQKQDKLKSAFYRHDGKPKMIECIRVDGANDEGPSHLEVQYWWTERHLQQANVVTLVTTRSSGSSYLNRVELQNGCLSRAHSNLFLPSTLHGSPISAETGKVDYDLLCRNLSTAIDIYIQRCTSAPCGHTQIKLYRGAEFDQSKREKLLVFLKASKKEQNRCKQTDPVLFAEFEKVWSLRERHMVTGVPSQYVFFLRCCYSPDCCHPLCQAGKPQQLPQWYPNGPTIDYFPLPVPDPSRPWGGSNCLECHQTNCYGHYLKPDELLTQKASVVKTVPPSQIIKEFHQALSRPPLQSEIASVARSVLLSESDVKMWIEHLQVVSENRKRGAAKAAATRKAKRREIDYYCGICSRPYVEETNEVESWIQCDKCNQWYHFDCAGIQEEPEDFLCGQC